MSEIGVADASASDFEIAASSPSGSWMPVFARRPFVADLVRYGACSAAALAIDWGTLTALITLGVAPLWASATGFCLGMAFTYTSSILFVFRSRRCRRAATEAALFVAIGLAGLGLTQILLWVAMVDLDLSAPIAKGPTAIAVFLFNFLVRRALLFARPGT